MAFIQRVTVQEFKRLLDDTTENEIIEGLAEELELPKEFLRGPTDERLAEQLKIHSTFRLKRA